MICWNYPILFWCLFLKIPRLSPRIRWSGPGRLAVEGQMPLFNFPGKVGGVIYGRITILHDGRFVTAAEKTI